MRISDYENEEAIELLADLLDPASTIMSDKTVAAMVKGKKPALKIASYILRNFKKQAIEIVSAMHRSSPSEFRFNALTLLNDLLDILNDPEVTKLFTLPGQTEGEKSFGSASENTEENQ